MVHLLHVRHNLISTPFITMQTCVTTIGKWYSVFPANECEITIPAHGLIPEKTIICPAGEFSYIHVPTSTIEVSDDTADILPLD